MNNLLYDDKNIKSIVEYAQKLENKTIEQVNSEQKSFAGKVEKNNTNKIVQNNNNKGGFGNYLESAYFGKENDNKSQPDFPEAKLELKASPLKTISNYDIRVKERLVLNHFTYFDLVKEEFETSHLKYKNENLLLVFYKYEKNKPYGQIEISLADLWQCFKEDEFQIKQDWNTIVQKIKNGKAHEISEGDTLYLGACTKGSTAES
ncbi:MAG: DNA mismatch repair protein, partial [Treponema bryantii]|nr:DNA mismatch repair protein [Treponema bryantii]